jgi:hypothetical protein
VAKVTNMRDEPRFKEVAITRVFFKNFPESGETTEEINRKVNLMLQACKDMYNLAREAESVALLHKARIMKEQLSEIFGFLRAQQQQTKSGLVTPSGIPATLDANAWMK